MRSNRVAVAALIAAVTAPAAFAQDAVQWRVEDGGNGHWYRLTDQTGAWDYVANLAILYGGVLASIGSDAENNMVRSLLGPTQEAWIGATKLPGVPWEWSDGSKWGFTLWCPGEPCCGDPERHIFLIASGCWNDQGGAATLQGVIEWSADCNGDGIVDYGQILDGTFADTNENGVPDCCDEGVSCDPCPGDVNFDGIVNGADISVLLGFWGLNGKPVAADINQDGQVDGTDLANVLGSWGPCP